MKKILEFLQKFIDLFKSKITIENKTEFKTERRQVVMSKGRIYLDGKELHGRKASRVKKAMEKASEKMEDVSQSMDVTSKEMNGLGKKIDKIFRAT